MLNKNTLISLFVIITGLFGIMVLKNQNDPQVKSVTDEQKIKAVIYKPACSI